MERGRNIGRGNGSGSCASAVDDTAKDECVGIYGIVQSQANKNIGVKSLKIAQNQTKIRISMCLCEIVSQQRVDLRPFLVCV